MKKFMSKGLVMVAGFLAVPGPSDFDQQLAEIPYTTERDADPRLERIESFLTERGAPASRYAEDFLAAADQNNLDWRLLPSISILESGGGKNCRNNNIFGWQNCERKFPSVQYGIQLVAKKLGNSRLYRDKNLDEILFTYNPRQDYGSRVKSMMQLLGPADLTPALTVP